MKDPLGKAILDYYNGIKNQKIIVESDLVEHDEIPVKYLFRDYNEMPELEKYALKQCKGNILDVGAGSGCHSIYLQDQRFNVTSLEISKLACETLTKRGVKQVVNSSFLDFKPIEKYDTILLLMNGIGISGDLNGLVKTLAHAISLLNENGKIIFDSSDLIYLYEEYDLNSETYYGEINFRMKYKNITGEWFKWLYVDFETLNDICMLQGYKVSLLKQGDHYDYLAQVIK